MENCKKLNTGDRILIFKNSKNMNELDGKNYIKGVIEECSVSKELSNHGYEIDVDLYKVKGEDGKIYTGIYRSPIVVVEYVDLLTTEDYINYLMKLKRDNIAKIDNILQHNKKIDSLIEEQNKVKIRNITKQRKD